MAASIEPFIHRKVVVLHQDTTIGQAARAMCDNKIGCVVVADHEGHVAGLLTDRDLACGVIAEAPGDTVALDRPLSDVMTPDPITVDENATMQEVVGLMEAHGIRRVPVVHQTENKRQKCVGIITVDDLLASRSIDYDHVSRVVQSQIFRRRGKLMQEINAERAELRSEAHTEQTFNRFFNVMAEGIEMKHETANSFVRHVLSDLVRRLHYTAAANLIAQLPQKLQDELLDLPAGPKREITAQRILTECFEKFGLSEQAARQSLLRFWSTLETLIDRGELGHLMSQLPEDLRTLFTVNAGEARQKGAA